MMTWAKRGDRPHCKAEQDRVMLKVWSAYRCMWLGTAGQAEAFDLLDAINIVRALCELDKLPADFQWEVDKANEGMRLHSLGERPYQHQLAALAEVCTRYDVAIFKLSANTLERAKHKFLGDLVAQAVKPDQVAA